jgi:catechol 2,3-dioxygenase-like lactoylglutathione lyase family enzyme
MSYLKGIRSIVFPTRDVQASITAWTQVLGKAPAYQAPGFAVFNDGANEVVLSQAPWVDRPLVFWKVEDIEEAHRALVASGAKAMGEIAGGSVAELGTAPVTNGDPTTGIVDVPGRRIAAVQVADGALIAILQEIGPRV